MNTAVPNAEGPSVNIFLKNPLACKLHVFVFKEMKNICIADAFNSLKDTLNLNILSSVFVQDKYFPEEAEDRDTVVT